MLFDGIMMAGNYVLDIYRWYLLDQQPTPGAHNDIKGIIMLSCL